MKTYVSHETALAYWRQHFPLDGEPTYMDFAQGADAFASRKADVLESVRETFRIPDRPVDVLVFEPGARRDSSQVACRVWSTKIPDRAFCRVGDMCVSSPEFVFLQMAASLSMPQLIALGFELCGAYVLLPDGVSHPGSLDESPKRTASLASVDSLHQFAQDAKGARGRQKALRALKYVVDGSRSPMETMVCMLLCLPPMLGGYGLPKCEMNAAIELNDDARKIAGRRYCEGDICWPDHQLDIEYHGEVHVGHAQMKSDVGRELGIEAMKWEVITLTSPQVLDADTFEVVAKRAAVRVKHRLYPRVMGATPARMTLHEELEQWMGLA